MLSLSRCEGYADCPLLWRGHDTEEGWTISILSSMGDPWVNDWTIYINAHFFLVCLLHDERAIKKRSYTASFQKRQKLGIMIHQLSDYDLREVVCGDQTPRVSALGGFATLRVSLQTSLSRNIFSLPFPSQRVSTRFRWGNGPISALNAALKRKCFVKERDSKISGPSYCIWFTKPLLSAKYLLADQVQSPLWD